jgi:hypothetical protein
MMSEKPLRLPSIFTDSPAQTQSLVEPQAKELPLLPAEPVHDQQGIAQLFQRRPDEITPENILNRLIEPENFELKSDVKNVLALSVLRTYALWLSDPDIDDEGDLRDLELRKKILVRYGIFDADAPVTPASLVYHTMTYLLLFGYSNKRKSRAELIEGLKALKSNEEEKARRRFAKIFGEM